MKRTSNCPSIWNPYDDRCLDCGEEESTVKKYEKCRQRRLSSLQRQVEILRTKVQSK